MTRVSSYEVPIVAIGAIESDREPLVRTLAALPPERRPAVIVAPRLAGSRLPDLSGLQAAAIAAIDGAPVLPGAIYAVGPDLIATVAGGRLRVTRGTGSPAEALFASLAEELGQRAVAVALGPGDECEAGLDAVRARGGVALAAAPGEAIRAQALREAIEHRPLARSTPGRNHAGKGLGVPITVGGEVVASLEFFSPLSAVREREVFRIIRRVGEQIGRAMERERAQRHLKSSHARLERTIEAAGIGTWAWDRSSGRLEWSDNMEAIHERPAGSFRGDLDSALAVVHPDDRGRLRGAFEQSLRGKGSEFRCEYRVIGRNGEPVWIEGRGNVVRGSEGEPIGIKGVCMDVTTRKQADARLRDSERRLREQARRLEEADRRKDEFLAMLAHELRNPLAPILSAAELLATQGAVVGSRYGRAVRILARQAEHMARIVDDLLDVARITRGRVTLRRERVDLREVVTAAAELARPHIDERRQRLHLDLPDAGVEVDGDRTRLVQIVGNLLDNASRYGEEDGNVWVSLGVADNRALISVRDDGGGISAELLPRIFDTFAQGDAALDRSRGGLGLGLTLVRQLTELHGGAVAAASPGPGHGAEFTVAVPLASGLAAPGPGPSEREVSCWMARRILVVDDNVDLAESLALLLRAAGHEVALAHNGRIALELAAIHRPEVVLLDIGMPELDGYEVARRLRCAEDWRPLLVAITGYGRDSDRQLAAEAGFDFHLLKPVRLPDLEAVLQSHERSAIGLAGPKGVEPMVKVVR